jgi:hypothetical protein
MRLRYGLLALSLGLAGSLAPSTPSTGLVRSAEARPMRHPAIHALLQDLTWIEAFNGERDDLRASSRIQEHIASVRTGLLQSLARQQPLHVTLQNSLGLLYRMGAVNARAMEPDPEVAQRVAGAIEHMRSRAEQVLTRIGSYPLPPRPGDYRAGVVVAPPVVVPMPNSFQQYATATPPPPQPQWQQPPQQQPQWQQQQQQQPQWQQQQQPQWQQQQQQPQWQQPPQPQPVMPMAPGAFAQALAQMQRLSFSNEKVNYANDLASSGNYFTCEQIAQLMRAASFGDDQVKIGATLYKNAVDPQNFTVLTTTLTFESDRQKLRRLLGR